jgi:hypothetical protein
VPLTVGNDELVGAAGGGGGGGTAASSTVTFFSIVAVWPDASVTVIRTNFVPASRNVNKEVWPVPSGHSGVIGWVGEPSSDHAYVHGPFEQVELEPSKVTASPTTGELGAKVNPAVGGVGGGGSGAEATGLVAAEVAELDPPSLLAVTTTRIMWPVSDEVGV